ncbi:hypothetical protein L2D14_00695 [Thalassospiraceae bacterium LMO-JJ14]|nr:hypothetical protein L2D14_00695 [Thalassospiraceae bacterium LMO-JJ14]
MFSRQLSLTLAGAFLLVSTAAHAVDVRNENEKPQEVLLSVWKDANGTDTVDTLITLAPGESRSGVCAACIVSLGKSEEAESVSAEQTDVVVIEKSGLLRLN